MPREGLGSRTLTVWAFDVEVSRRLDFARDGENVVLIINNNDKIATTNRETDGKKNKAANARSIRRSLKNENRQRQNAR